MVSRTDAATQHELSTRRAGREPWFAQDADRVVAAMDSDAERGLSRAEAAARLSRYGPNRIAEREAAVGVGDRAAAAARPDEHHAGGRRRR